MADKENLLNVFTHNFVQKKRRERTLYLLKNVLKRRQFTDMLNHRWEDVLEMKYLVESEKGKHSYEQIKKTLGMLDKDECYIISDGEHDEEVRVFREAYAIVEGSCFATLLLNSTADKLYFKTELVGGSSFRYTGNIH